ncbi:MAG: Uma2 family endonuclease [Lachnospiraceae bacterium]|jgi:Uma2 family endonuclease|nr:Uma2 family endonuclease [Lachnospiraceae bacterium]MCI8996427.1 Uma2 family endonuclease [Lachnospiraceae bacterium]MCI9134039.1 Uma2 family endonuclease [Lachnospiraceae bacterium]
MALQQKRTYTIEDIYALPEGQRAELIDGQMYQMAPPNRMHQKLINRLSQKITNYIDSKRGECEVYPAPFAVFLNEDDRNYIEPDISVICDKTKLDEYGCNGAPDWVIEITSPSNPQNDYGIKLFKYRTAGVREYWIVNPQKKTVTVFDFEFEKKSNQYSFDDDIPVCIYDDLIINIENMLV